MSVSVAGRQIHRLLMLSESAQVVLGLIPGGIDWMEWAIRHPRARYHFVDESALVAAVPVGLHGSALLLMPALGLKVGPAKLMTLDPEDLCILAAARTEDRRVKRILADHDLVTQAELARDRPILEDKLELGDPLPLVLEGMGFDDQLSIHALLWPEQPLPESAPPAEAAAFAIELAASPLEFADYYRAYLQYLSAAPPRPLGERGRMARVRDAIQLLEPLLYDALDCPRIDGQGAHWEVALAIDEWLLMGRRLGFSRLSRGAQQIIAHTSFPCRDDDAEAPRIVAAYLVGAQVLLGSAKLGPRRIAQDGISATFPIRSEAEEAVVALSPDGIITLGGFRTLPEPPAPPATTKRRK
ncbi:MAG TPA: hypothetical protein VGW40_07390 [Allosphingosinicella sp.]|nr:hypothetical protein [Allosphingosinicella sp.]